jgi:hypothetical protein
MKALLARCGFVKPSWTPLTFGVVSVYEGTK